MNLYVSTRNHQCLTLLIGGLLLRGTSSFLSMSRLRCQHCYNAVLFAHCIMYSANLCNSPGGVDFASHLRWYFYSILATVYPYSRGWTQHSIGWIVSTPPR
ncbi:hypothetical protein C8R43DRAFT_360753 [Mycena crocata]|nr:hypothetical protein C8R43DRAFT_360753 [Mycena crocata]